jgi:hypothetical protein
VLHILDKIADVRRFFSNFFIPLKNKKRAVRAALF